MNNRRLTDGKAWTVAKWAEVLGIISLVIAAYIYIDEWKTDRRESKLMDTQLQQEILDTDIDRNAKIRDHYDNIEMERPLTKAEEKRRQYVIDRMERQYIKQERLEAREDSLK